LGRHHPTAAAHMVIANEFVVATPNPRHGR
jgi:hypothetical protein